MDWEGRMGGFKGCVELRLDVGVEEVCARGLVMSLKMGGEEVG